MIKHLTQTLAAIFIASSCIPISAQAPVDGFYPGNNNGTLALSASFEKYNEFFLGTGESVPWLGDYNTTSIGIYGTYGITDDFALALSIPYIVINTIYFNSEEVNRGGIQDLGFYAKYKLFHFDMSALDIEISPSVGFTTPLSNYIVDFYGVGQGATSFDLRSILMARWNNGLFAEIQGAGLVRLDPAPSGSQFNLKLGYFNEKMYADLYYTMQNISGGEDLPSPANYEALGVSYQRAGFTVAYNIFSALGIYLGGATTLDGENVGKSNRFTGGGVFRF
ncbi:MAG: hypothetical protein ACK4IY_08620 [Chitinophagales bacterium]